MSRQNKAAKKKIVAQQFTKLHLAGDKGPSRTTPKHGKVNTDKAARIAKLIADAKAAEVAAARPAAKPKTTGKGSKGSKYAGKKAA